ncbi:MAG: hypothetical protein Aurels2KO_21500 [Aureliella sp.]
MNKSDAPILVVEPVLIDGYIKRYRVWCKFCEDWHYHGSAEGHRECHCSNNADSAYHATGYVLKLRSAIDSIIGGRG